MATVDYDGTINAFVEKIRVLKKENDALRADDLSFREEIKSMRSESKQFKQNFETIQGKMFQYKEKYLQIKEECIDTINDLNKTNNDRLMLNEKLKNLEEKYQTHKVELEQKIESLTSELSELKKSASVIEYKEQIQKLQDENSKMGSALYELKENKDATELLLKSAEIKIRDLDKECECTKSNNSAFLSQIKTIEDQCEQLRSEMEDMRLKERKREEQFNQLKESHSDINLELENSKAALREKDGEFRDKLTEMESERTALDIEIKNLKTKNEEYSILLDKKTNELKMSELNFDSKIEGLTGELDRTKKNNKQDISHLNERYDVLLREHEHHKVLLLKKENEISQLVRDSKEMTDKNRNLENKLLSLTKDLGKARASTTRYDTKISSLESSFIEVQSENAALKEKISEDDRRLLKIQNDVKKKNADITFLKKKIETANTECNGRLFELDQHCSTLEREKHGLSTENIALISKIKLLINRGEELKTNLAVSNDKTNKLQAQLDNLVTTNERLVQTLGRERMNHQETEKFLNAERVANKTLIEKRYDNVNYRLESEPNNERLAGLSKDNERNNEIATHGRHQDNFTHQNAIYSSSQQSHKQVFRERDIDQIERMLETVKKENISLRETLNQTEIDLLNARTKIAENVAAVKRKNNAQVKSLHLNGYRSQPDGQAASSFAADNSTDLPNINKPPVDKTMSYAERNKHLIKMKTQSRR